MEPSRGFLYAPTMSKSAFRALLNPKGITMTPELAASPGINLDPCGRESGSPDAADLPEGWFNAAMLRPSLLASPMPGWEEVRRAAEAAAWEMKLRERQQRVAMEEDTGAEHQLRLSRNLAEAAAAVRSSQCSAALAKNADDEHRPDYAPTGGIHAGTTLSSSSSRQQQQQQQRETYGTVAPSTRPVLEVGVRHGAEPNGTSHDAPGFCPQPSRRSSMPASPPSLNKRKGSKRHPTPSLSLPSAVARTPSAQFGGSGERRLQHQEHKEEKEEEGLGREEEELLERIRLCPASASLWIGDSECSDAPGMPWRTPQSLAGFTELQFLLDAEFAASRLRQRPSGDTKLKVPSHPRKPGHGHESFDHTPQ